MFKIHSIYIVSIVFSMLFLFTVLYLVRRRKLKEQYSLLWILVAVLMFVISLNRNSIESLAAFFNIKYAPAMLFLFGLVFCFSLILHLTMVISRLSEQLVRLTQEFSILRQRFQDNITLERTALERPSPEKKGSVERSEG